MKCFSTIKLPNWLATAAMLLSAAISPPGIGALADSDPTGAAGSAASLGARFDELKGDLSNNQFKRPLYLNSTETGDRLSGEIYAMVNQPFASAGAGLSQASQWCDVLMLHLNTKFCKETENGSVGTQLHVAIGKKFDQPVDKAYRVDFVYQLVARTDNYLQVRLNADEGPLSTRNYLILLEAAPAPSGQTYVRLSYSYSYGAMAQLAMKAYLGTVGRNKVGFTMVRDTPDAKPEPIRGVRGVVERNTMRYYLAIEAYLGALNAPAATRVEKSFRDWFLATESYPRQLHEMEEGDYLDMKRKEYQRLQAPS